MGQKVHPTGIRLGIVKEHTSVWYARRPYVCRLYCLQNMNVREYLQDKLKSASVGVWIFIVRHEATHHHPHRSSRHSNGKKGEDVPLRQDLTKQMGVPVHINIEEIRKPELDAMLVAQDRSLSSWSVA
ncbi:Small ribosomal subunit protein uS3 OS=Stutzerimonas stutzeri OX=316 GN=rpsC PE=3 SV=1 [Stutzerimonas stutzeri]